MKKNDINTIYTIKDLINYLETLDPDKKVYGEYIDTFLGSIKGYKERPLLIPLVEEYSDYYKFKALIY